MSTISLAEASRTVLRLYKDELRYKGITQSLPATKALEEALAADPSTIIRNLLAEIDHLETPRKSSLANAIDAAESYLGHVTEMADSLP